MVESPSPPILFIIYYVNETIYVYRIVLIKFSVSTKQCVDRYVYRQICVIFVNTKKINKSSSCLEEYHHEHVWTQFVYFGVEYGT